MDDLYQEFLKYKRTKRLVIALVVLIVVGSSIVAGVFNAKESYAFDPNQFLYNVHLWPVEMSFKVKDNLEKITSKTFKSLSAIAYKNAVKNLFSRLAFESASNLADSAFGKKPAFETNIWKSIQQQADGALGDYLNNTVGRMWGKNLCEPLDPLTKVRIGIAARRIIEPQKPRCKSSQIRRNLQRLKLDDLVDFSTYFNPNANDLGAMLTITSNALQIRAKAEIKAKTERKTYGEFNPVPGLIDKDTIRTPAGFISGYYANMISESLTPYGVYTGDAIADAVGVFTNTLTSKLLQHMWEGFYKPKGEPGGGGSYSPSYGGLGPSQAVREQFADLGEIDYNFGGTVDVLSNLSCGTQHQFSCVIDSPLKTLLDRKDYLTVKQAMDQGFLHGTWPFGFEGKSKGTATTKENIYSYRSIVIMRKYRIVPVGWELAAQYFGQFDNSGRQITLASLIEDYDNPDSPYFKLVDPNWVLKAPEFKCYREGPGELTEEETINMSIDANLDGEITEDERNELVIRLDYCADERSCIKEGGDGCQDYAFGYCTEEKPVWNIHGNKCEPVFNTCRAYKLNGVEVAYLMNTVAGQDGLCDSSNKGCREYAQDWLVDEYRWDETGDKIYLNYRASDNVCDESQAGCSRFIRVSQAVLVDENMTSEEAKTQLASGTAFESVIDYEYSRRTNLRKAPSYYDCDGFANVIGTDENNCAGFWRDDIESCVESGSYECADYALYCEAEDEGCKFYSPVLYNGPQVPGVAGKYDMCPAECAGYKSYLEQPSFFEPVIPVTRENPINFIASTAQTCPASHNGCEEFTNLSEGSAGERKEYYSSIRYCVTPDDTNSDIQPYYSWASSEESGNQLRTWKLLKSNLGGWPCTNIAGAESKCSDGTGDNAPHECSFSSVNLDDNPIYNPDCIEFIDTQGNSYWMKYSRIVFASQECTPFRRTYDQQVYTGIPRLSQTCSADSTGCRQYKGSAANNIKIILEDDFEDGTVQDWQGGGPSNESVIANGHSLAAADHIFKDVSGLVNEGRSYKLTFWAKARGASAAFGQIYFSGNADNVNSNSMFSGTDSKMSDDWQQYVFDLTYFNRPVEETEYLAIKASDDFYIDNIQLTETQDDLYLIKDSWQTPASCQEVVDNRDMVGCEQYKDAKGKDWYLRSFERLCRDEVVGCEEMIDMYNTDDPADDSLEYLVYDENKKCSSAGCKALGLVFTDRDGEIYTETKYLVADENDYGGQSSPLCEADEVWCEAFEPLNNDPPEYFKNPNVFSCEYSQGPGGKYGWHIAGDSTRACPSSIQPGNKCIGGRSIINKDNICYDGNPDTNDDNNCIDYESMIQGGICSSWVGLCPVSQDFCTEYQDPANPAGCDNQVINGQDQACDFYYYKSNSVATCSLDEMRYDPGCRAFHQVGGGDDKYYSTPRCEGAEGTSCESDADCALAGGTGKCVYQ